MSHRDQGRRSRRLLLALASTAGAIVPLAAILTFSQPAAAGPPNTGIVCTVEYWVWDVQLLLGPAAPPFCVS